MYVCVYVYSSLRAPILILKYILPSRLLPIFFAGQERFQ